MKINYYMNRLDEWKAFLVIPTIIIGADDGEYLICFSWGFWCAGCEVEK